MVSILEVTTHNCAAATRLTSVTLRIICPPSFDRTLITLARNTLDEIPISDIFQIGTDIMASSFWYDRRRMESSALYEKINELSFRRLTMGNVSWTQTTLNDHHLLVTIELFQVLRIR